MSACRSLQHIFENPLPENPTLLESLSWNQIKPLKSIDHSSSSFAEIYGKLHFKESSEPSIPSYSSSSFAKIEHAKLRQNEVSDINQTPYSAYVSSTPITNHTNSHKSSDCFSCLNSDRLQLCTEGLGSESSDDVEDLKGGINEWWQTQREKEGVKKHLPFKDSYGEYRTRSRVNGGGEYPPPISCIGKSGWPWVRFRSSRKNGRFVLREIRIPTQELLYAHREDGRLMLHFVEPDEDFLEDEEEEDQEENIDIESIDEGEEITGKENVRD